MRKTTKKYKKDFDINEYRDSQKKETAELLKNIDEQVDLFKDSSEYIRYLKMVSNVTKYSAKNAVLISRQMPDATMVKGYNTWKNEFKRHVKKGEEGIRILQPIRHKYTKQVKEYDVNTGQLVEKSELAEYTTFKAISVFDVSQTEGEPLPDISPKALEGDVLNFETISALIEHEINVPVDFLLPSENEKSQGFYDKENNRLVVYRGDELQMLKSLIHGAALTLLENENKNQDEANCEAEAVSYVVCQRLGYDTSSYSVPYLAKYKNAKTTLDGLDNINKVSRRLCSILV